MEFKFTCGIYFFTQAFPGNQNEQTTLKPLEKKINKKILTVSVIYFLFSMPVLKATNDRR